ncbi:hypothetical protein TCA2_4574 [Paenibacillus sp. TCA20]|uniref:hypothetical protein n=1 Tax=Paenibacillus sp. TCA20 TaxID=1499968 RepID=UPI0004D81AE7|nr:hypothetical protein [Paenibacillus sp. TCA20]GAK42082.1 hypothetical protein TCA2_4574 [Paenibacillus sp. TCA20]
MPTIEKVLFYFDDDNVFPYEMDFADVLGNTGISTSEGYSIVPEIQSADNLTIRIVNFAPPLSSPSSKFGSLLGIAYVYDNGVKSWIEEVVRYGPNSSNLEVAIGDWVDGKTISQVRSDARYRKPYIGYVEAQDYVEYRIEAYQDPPPPHVPLSGTIDPPEVRIRIGETASFKITLTGSNTTIRDCDWFYDADSTIVRPISFTDLTNSARFSRAGTYHVTYNVNNTIGENFTISAPIYVADPAPILVDILQPSTHSLSQGESLALDAIAESEAEISLRRWDIPTGVDILNQNGEQAILSFNRLGTYTIKFYAENVEGSHGEDSVVVSVLEPPKKKPGIELWIGTNDGQVQVNPSIMMNELPINKDDIFLSYKNSGDSAWKFVEFKVEVGAESFTYMDGRTQIQESVTIAAGGEYRIRAALHDYDARKRYTIILKAVMNDDQGQALTRFYELRWIATADDGYDLVIVERRDDNYHYPNIMKRNARYRGQRESEKVLSDHQEQILDIRLNHMMIENHTKNQDDAVKSWFQGENEAGVENITYSAVKTFSINMEQTSYPLMPGVAESSFSRLVVFLDGAELNSPGDFVFENGYIKLKSNALQIGDMKVEYTVTVAVAEQKMNGLYPVANRMNQMNEHLAELERRLQSYENAYK